MKRVTIKNTPMIRESYSKNNYTRANNISEMPFMSGLNHKIFKNDYAKRKKNITKNGLNY
jgi:hypothetical protein